MQKPVILIDGMSLVFRAYHGLSRTGMKTATGEPTFAVFAFANILVALLEQYQPDEVAVVFDTEEPTFRHELYPSYKAHRDAFPDDLVSQLERIKEFIDILGIRRVQLPGFEADDIIGTIARREEALGNDVLCVTSDKDYFQLVTENVNVLRPGSDAAEYRRMGPTEVSQSFGVPPALVVDVLALMGDASDNVPGVKGVGSKTALPLIEQFGSVEKIYDNLDAIERDSLRRKFSDAREMAFLSKELVTIRTDVPLQDISTLLQRNDIHRDQLLRFCSDMELHSLRRRLLGGGSPSQSSSDAVVQKISDSTQHANSFEVLNPAYKHLDDVEHQYTLVADEYALAAMTREIEGCSVLAVDTETSSLDTMQCQLVGISLSPTEGQSFYIAIQTESATKSMQNDLFDSLSVNPDQANTSGGINSTAIPVQIVAKTLGPLLQNPAIMKVGQNLKFDALVLKRHSMEIYPITFDTMLASYILDSESQHGMDALARRWLNYEPIPISSLIGVRKSEQRSMADLPPEEIRDYACEDADVTMRLYNVLNNELVIHGLHELASGIEFPLIPVLVAMEYNGVRVDVAALKSLASYMYSEAARLEKEIQQEAGLEFNVASTKQVGEVLFERMQLPTGRRTKSGYSTDASVLSELALSYPIAGLILEYRKVEKLRSTYVEALPRLINPRTGRVHTTYNQTIAGTGRLSSTDPNLQNIPIRTELGQQIRKAFVPQEKDWLILACDYSQIELRIMASISGDDNLITAFASGADIHASTAAILFDTALESVSADQRRIAKTVNFGIMYGQGALGLARQLSISRAEASAIIDNYFEKYPGIKAYMDNTIASTRHKGYAQTLMGRRRHYPLIASDNRKLRAEAERAAVNMPIQGTAADMMKLAMIGVHAAMTRENVRTKLIMQVHDELVFEAPGEELEVIKEIALREMENALPLEGVPVVVNAAWGKSWFEAHA